MNQTTKLIAQAKTGMKKIKTKVTTFVLDERSARGSAEEGNLAYGAVIIGIVVLLIGSQFMDTGVNVLGNFFVDGVSGSHNESGLNEWGTHTDGFNRE